MVLCGLHLCKSLVCSARRICAENYCNCGYTIWLRSAEGWRESDGALAAVSKRGFARSVRFNWLLLGGFLTRLKPPQQHVTVWHLERRNAAKSAATNVVAPPMMASTSAVLDTIIVLAAITCAEKTVWQPLFFSRAKHEERRNAEGAPQDRLTQGVVSVAT